MASGFICMFFCFSIVLRPTREYSAHMKKSNIASGRLYKFNTCMALFVFDRQKFYRVPTTVISDLGIRTLI